MSFKLQRLSISASGGINGVDFIDVPTSGGSPVWGGITGTLSGQTDLQAALDAKGTSNFNGTYAALTGKPTLGTAAAAATGDFATAAQGTKADSALQANPNIGAATGTSLAATGAVKSSGTDGIGYAAGAGGAVTQLTNKSTGVTLNKICGQITMHAAALAAAAEVSFVVTNSTVQAGDCVIVNHGSAGTGGAYSVNAHTIGNGSFRVMVGNMSTGSLSQAIVINFVVIKAVAA